MRIIALAKQRIIRFFQKFFFKKILVPFRSRKDRLPIILTFNKWIPQIEVHERHEKKVKNLLRMITLIGILTSVISLPWYAALFVSIIFAGIEQLLEKTIFVIKSLFVHPIPEYKKGDWIGMVWGHGGVFHIAPLFKDKDSMSRMFQALKAWNNNQKVDIENNICISIIIDELEDIYYVYLYPNYERDSVLEAEEKIKKDNPNRKNVMTQMGMTLRNSFTLSTSQLMQFLSVYKPGNKYFLAPYYFGPESRPILSKEIDAIEKNHLKVMKIGQLKREDHERDMGLILD